MEHFAIICLAAWRLTSIINREKIAAPVRRILAKEKETSPGMFSYGDNFFSYLIMCFQCLSVWVALGCFLVYLLHPYFLYPLAISGIVILLEKVYSNGVG